MDNKDIERLKSLAIHLAESGLTVTASIVGSVDDYELVTYVDSVVVEDSIGNEVVVIDKEDYDSEG